MTGSAYDDIKQNDKEPDDDVKLLLDDASKFVLNSVRERIMNARGGIIRINPNDDGMEDMIDEINTDLTEAVRNAVRIINNKIFVLTNEGGKCVVGYYKRRDDLMPELRVQGCKDFLFGHGNFKVLVQLNPRPQLNRTDFVYKSMAQIWFDSTERQEYEGMLLEPDDPEKVINGFINLWRGFSVTPQEGEWGLMHNHIREVLANNDQESYDYIIRWLAWCVQNPGQLAETAICLVGKQGTGKTSVGRWIMKVFGVHGYRPTSSRQVTGTFNFQLRDKAFVLMDEALNPESRAAANVMKGLITDNVLSYEAKGRDAIIAKNMLKIIIVSNHDHFVDVEEGDRRFAVFRVNPKYKGNNEYFKKLNAQANDGGIEAMLHYLLAFDLSGWHPRNKLVETQERIKQKVKSLKDIDQFIYNFISDGMLPYSGLDDVPDRWASSAALIELAARKYNLIINAMDLFHHLRKVGAAKFRVGKVNGYTIDKLADCRRTWVESERPFAWDAGWSDEEWGVHVKSLF